MNARPMFTRLQMVCAALANARQGITARQLAAICEVDRKTIYRDIDALRQMGVQVDSKHDGFPIVGYALHASTCPFCGQDTLRGKPK